MPDADAARASETVKDFAEGFSAQSKLSNRLWIALVALIFVVLLPAPPSCSPESGRNLPFGIGPVDSNWFDGISFFMLAVLTIAFCQAQAQAVRGYRAAHQFITNMGERKSDLVRRERLYLDLFSIPTLTRVGPLPVLLLSESSWIPWRFLVAAYYLLLKIVAISIQIGLPGVALYFAWEQLQGNESVPWWVLYVGHGCGVVAFLALIEIFFAELSATLKTTYRMAKGDV